VVSELARAWFTPCEAAFEYLSRRYPESLLRVIRSGLLLPADLTFAAEIAGRADTSEDEIRTALIPLLAHEDAAVREGAIYGLAGHIDRATRERIESLARSDSSAGVRAAAADALSPE
jgi:HEAT repeat protein